MATTLAVGGLAFAEFLALAYLFTSVGIFSVAGIVVLGQLWSTSWPAVGHVGSIAVYPPDVVFASLLLAGLARISLWGRASIAEAGVLILLVVLLASLLRGFAAFGANAAGNEARTMFYLAGGTLYFASSRLSGRVLRLFRSVWLGTAAILVLIAVAKLAAVYLDLPILRVAGVRGYLGVLNGDATLILLQAMLLLLFGESASTAARRSATQAFAVVLFLAVLVMQQRTVWVAAATALAAGFTVGGRRLRGFALKVVVTLAALAGLALIAAPVRQALVLPNAVASSAEERGTLNWRIAGWKAIIAQTSGNVTDAAIGSPFGPGFERTLHVSGRTATTDVSPHSLYVRTYARLGILGLVVMLALLVGPLLAHSRARERSYPSGRMWVPLGITLIVYSVAYYLGPGQTVVLGMFLAASSSSSRLAEGGKTVLSPGASTLRPNP